MNRIILKNFNFNQYVITLHLIEYYPIIYTICYADVDIQLLEYFLIKLLLEFVTFLKILIIIPKLIYNIKTLLLNSKNKILTINQMNTSQQIQQKQFHHQPQNLHKSIQPKQKQVHILIVDDNGQQNTTQIDKQRIRNKKYDYLNKYHQHQLLGKFYQSSQLGKVDKIVKKNRREQDVSMVETRKNFLQRRGQDRRSVSRENQTVSLTKSQPKSQPKSKPQCRSHSRSSSNSRNISNNKNTSTYHNYLQAYQNNIPAEHKPYSSHSFSPKRPTYQLSFKNPQQIQKNQTRLNKIACRIPNISNGLNIQLTHQNQLYRNQINQYRTLLTRLQHQLSRLKQQLLLNQQQLLNQRINNDKIVTQLKNQILLLAGYKQRYEILNQEMINMKMRQYNDMEVQNKQNYRNDNNYQDMSALNRSINKGRIKKVQANSIQRSIFQRIQSIINANGNKIKKNLFFNLHPTSQQILQKIQKIVQSNRKYDNFVFNIKEMYKKIDKIQSTNHVKHKNSIGNQPTIKQLWKWLKIIGANYSFMLEIKPLLARKVGISQSQQQSQQTKQILQLLLIQR